MTDTPRRLSAALLTLICCSTLNCPQSPGQEVTEVDFQRQIRPILSNHCFPCHGADETSRQADLRLDVRDDAVRAAILPGNAADSPFIHRITATDPDVVMPPPDSGKPLTDDQITQLRAWINKGADYQQHWAFVPVQRPAMPPQHSDAWCRNPIDAFILNRLHQAGLSPSPEASRGMLIRRLYQDLAGILPSPAETAEFIADQSPDAWEQLVDRVLQSPHYGERWGRHWLDQARYADSNGYTIDGPRVMWPYRDWVIAAFNNDLPFDQFTIEQLAGDLLESPTLSQRIATGFHRNTMINEEGGVKPDQFRNEAVIDRVNTTGAVWLGLTIGCAQCHSHKYDPISHTDYYRLYAFFNAQQTPTVSEKQWKSVNRNCSAGQLSSNSSSPNSSSSACSDRSSKNPLSPVPPCRGLHGTGSRPPWPPWVLRAAAFCEFSPTARCSQRLTLPPPIPSPLNCNSRQVRMVPPKSPPSACER
ncbi:MAG: DUF1549 domain-containing protein [Planctomycetaceae bacterium]